MFETRFDVEFGDCDPAGIVFYPRFFSWFDAAFQRWLRERGTDQAAIQARFDAVGTGLVDVRANFRAPVRPGDALTVVLVGIEWDERTFALAYEGRRGEQVCVEGTERRGLFARRPDGRLGLVPLSEFRAMIGA